MVVMMGVCWQCKVTSLFTLGGLLAIGGLFTQRKLLWGSLIAGYGGLLVWLAPRYQCYNIEQHVPMAFMETVKHLGWNLFIYSRNILFPFFLDLRYKEYFVQGEETWGPVIAVGLLSVILLVEVVRQARRNKNVLVGLLWALFTYLPYCGVKPIPTSIADRFFYLPWMGVMMCVAAWRELVGGEGKLKAGGK